MMTSPVQDYINTTTLLNNILSNARATGDWHYGVDLVVSRNSVNLDGDMTDKRRTTHPNADAFPLGLSGPALRARAHAGVKSMNELAKWTEADLVALHGMGPKGIRMLKDGIAKCGGRLRGT